MKAYVLSLTIIFIIFLFKVINLSNVIYPLIDLKKYFNYECYCIKNTKNRVQFDLNSLRHLK